LKGDFGFSPENATSPAPVIGHEIKLNQLQPAARHPARPEDPEFARNSTGAQRSSAHQRFNRPTM